MSSRRGCAGRSRARARREELVRSRASSRCCRRPRRERRAVAGRVSWRAKSKRSRSSTSPRTRGPPTAPPELPPSPRAFINAARLRGVGLQWSTRRSIKRRKHGVSADVESRAVPERRRRAAAAGSERGAVRLDLQQDARARLSRRLGVPGAVPGSRPAAQALADRRDDNASAARDRHVPRRRRIRSPPEDAAAEDRRIDAAARNRRGRALPSRHEDDSTAGRDVAVGRAAARGRIDRGVPARARGGDHHRARPDLLGTSAPRTLHPAQRRPRVDAARRGRAGSRGPACERAGSSSTWPGSRMTPPPSNGDRAAEVLRLAYIDGLGVRAIARRLGMSRKTVRRWRARRRAWPPSASTANAEVLRHSDCDRPRHERWDTSAPSGAAPFPPRRSTAAR
jgi:Homeodomain-like domain